MSAQLPVVVRGVAEVVLTLCGASAACEDAQQRVFGIHRNVRPQAEFRRYDSVEDYGAHAFGESPRIMLCYSRSVRAPIQIDALISQHRSHTIEVLDGDACRVERGIRVGTDLLQAAPRFLGHRVSPGYLGDHVVIELAVQSVRPPGTALIDEHDVPVPVNPLEGEGGRRIKRRRRHAGAARQHEQGVRALAPIDRGHAGHIQPDLAARGVRGIFRDRQLAALGFGAGQPRRVLQVARR